MWDRGLERLKTQCIAASEYLASLDLVDPDGCKYRKLRDDSSRA
jgi:hypothetical protein